MSSTAAVVVTLDDDGHLTIPREISDAAGIGLGRRVRLAVVGPGRLEVIASDSEAVPEIVAENRQEAESGPIEPMTIEEAFSRFVTDEHVDVRAIRLAWERDATDEVLEEMARNAR